MSEKKNQNSFLFLTTLGVYLGLVLVGATPVLGHAATTRNFEITDEIEIKDDLDRKPDDEKRSPLAMSIGNYYADLEYLVASLEKLRKSGKFDPAVDTFELSQSSALPCVANNKVGSYTAETLITANEILRSVLESATKRLTDGYAFADCVPSERFGGQEATHSRFVLKLTADGLTLEVSGVMKSPADAAAFLRDLKAGWDQFRLEAKAPLQKHISDGTVLSVNGNKILVVTRLPRAALTTLLAKDAKAAA